MVLRILCWLGYPLGAALLVTGFWRPWQSDENLQLPGSPYAVPVIPHQFAGPIRYLSKSRPGKYDTDSGPDVYLHHHRAGWNECLVYFYGNRRDFSDAATWHEMDDARDNIPWLIGAPPHIVTARRHGWLSCVDRIIALSAEMSEDELRRSLPGPHISWSSVGCGLLIVGGTLLIHVRRKVTASDLVIRQSAPPETRAGGQRFTRGEAGPTPLPAILPPPPDCREEG